MLGDPREDLARRRLLLVDKSIAEARWRCRMRWKATATIAVATNESPSVRPDNDRLPRGRRNRGRLLRYTFRQVPDPHGFGSQYDGVQTGPPSDSGRCGLPHEPVRVGEGPGIAGHREPVRSGAVGRDAGDLGEGTAV
jgi:hypothetical protein